MWLQCHMPLHCPKENQKEKENKINIKSEKLDKRKEKLSVSKAFYNNSKSSRRDKKSRIKSVEKWQVANWKWLSIKKDKDICSERWGVKVGDYSASSQYANSKT